MTAMANPLSMFDVTGKVALITGASGAFGMVAARVLAGAGCRLVLVAKIVRVRARKLAQFRFQGFVDKQLMFDPEF